MLSFPSLKMHRPISFSGQKQPLDFEGLPYAVQRNVIPYAQFLKQQTGSTTPQDLAGRFSVSPLKKGTLGPQNQTLLHKLAQQLGFLQKAKGTKSTFTINLEAIQDYLKS